MIMAWISYHIHNVILDVIAHPCPEYSDGWFSKVRTSVDNNIPRLYVDVITYPNPKSGAVLVNHCQLKGSLEEFHLVGFIYK